MLSSSSCDMHVCSSSCDMHVCSSSCDMHVFSSFTNAQPCRCLRSLQSSSRTEMIPVVDYATPSSLGSHCVDFLRVHPLPGSPLCPTLGHIAVVEARVRGWGRRRDQQARSLVTALERWDAVSRIAWSQLAAHRCAQRPGVTCALSTVFRKCAMYAANRCIWRLVCRLRGRGAGNKEADKLRRTLQSGNERRRPCASTIRAPPPGPVARSFSGRVWYARIVPCPRRCCQPGFGLSSSISVRAREPPDGRSHGGVGSSLVC